MWGGGHFFPLIFCSFPPLVCSILSVKGWMGGWGEIKKLIVWEGKLPEFAERNKKGTIYLLKFVLFSFFVQDFDQAQ